MSVTQAGRQPVLPPIRASIEEAKEDLARYGVTRVSGAASMADIEAARARLVEQAAGEAEAGVAHTDSGYTAAATEQAANQRVWNLLNKGDIFASFALNETARALAGHIVGPAHLLFSSTANIARRGGMAQRLHGDQVFAPAETPFPLIANTMWMLDDFTENNGATRVVPETHELRSWPAEGDEIATVASTGPRGTLMVWDGRLWHGTGENVTDTPRHGMIIAYCAPFLRPQENHTVSLRPEVIAGASPELLELAGFQHWYGLGMIDGYSEGPRTGRPEKFSTIMAPTRPS
ncbi:phytanoyl-CoA dioxygenase family protein [Sphingopyxis sp.]|jgi:ectoine hydroxylase-related dioxygenase (phytanoyl-CoA dioxygenase family)|uniref:phytanoyl-CoA dioxygenase family protein n=1 Tax=Sphingopyxis sp. TaxID=1908224 RepID=UPI002DF0DB27|nr:phytanoyl-CoA dioxygenase family protein [Sphingopyxis sp.]